MIKIKFIIKCHLLKINHKKEVRKQHVDLKINWLKPVLPFSSVFYIYTMEKNKKILILCYYVIK